MSFDQTDNQDNSPESMEPPLTTPRENQVEEPVLTLQLGNRWKRLFAWVLDWIILAILILILDLIFGIQFRSHHLTTHYFYFNQNGGSDRGVSTYYSYHLDFGVLIVAEIVSTLYYVLFDVLNRGQTLGKAVMGLRVVMIDGSDITLRAALLREFLGKTILDFIPIIYALVDNFFILGDHRKQALHDKIASTVVIEARTKTQTGTVHFIN
jgi:uncharacterized RDD family membrane protein YckC